MRWLAHPDRDVYCTGQVLNLIIGGRDVRAAILGLSQVRAGHATRYLATQTTMTESVHGGCDTVIRRRIWLLVPRESPSTYEWVGKPLP